MGAQTTSLALGPYLTQVTALSVYSRAINRLKAPQSAAAGAVGADRRKAEDVTGSGMKQRKRTTALPRLRRERSPEQTEQVRGGGGGGVGGEQTCIPARAEGCSREG